MFQEKTGYVNWQLIAKADLESLQRTGDLSLMQTYAQGLIYSQLRKEDVQRIGNDTFVKLFKLSQLAVEYLLYVQDLLESTARAADMEYLQLQKQCMEAEAVAKGQRDKIAKVKKRVHKKKKALEECNSVIKEATVSRQNPMYGCRICKDKYYVSEKALEGHYRRWHPSSTMQPEEKQASPRFRREEETRQHPRTPQVSAEQVEERVKDVVQRETARLREVVEKLGEKVAASREDPGENRQYEREMLEQIQRLKNKMSELEARRNVPPEETKIEEEKEMRRPIVKKRPELSFNTFENEYKRPAPQIQPESEHEQKKEEPQSEMKTEVKSEPSVAPKQMVNNTITEAGSINIEAIITRPKEVGVEGERILRPAERPETVSVEIQSEALHEEDKAIVEEPLVSRVKGTIKDAEVGKVVQSI
eukprot:TRINITY_DN2616_c0_g2_i3.p2 TRINITY_DN2616_c0_g2~~TRINITY_DN2616_c0_g2_i3.p2  ORF type:complete len:419 (+),score=155.57 TRINITY_DN2616_c0_g2_i3:1531-2787(+)